MAKKISVEDAAKEHVALKASEREIKKRLKQLKKVLEPALEKEPGMTSEWHGWRFTLTPKTRENFSLKKAKLKIDGRTLAPFITESSFTEIRTSWQGGDEVAD